MEGKIIRKMLNKNAMATLKVDFDHIRIERRKLVGVWGKMSQAYREDLGSLNNQALRMEHITSYPGMYGLFVKVSQRFLMITRYCLKKNLASRLSRSILCSVCIVHCASIRSIMCLPTYLYLFRTSEM